MGKHWLVCHPDTPARKVGSIAVETGENGANLWFRFHVECELEALALPDPAKPDRCDGLWQTTCFEAFVGEGGYAEFNFSPSSQWAAYRFERYREGVEDLLLTAPPEIGLDASEGHFALEATMPREGLGGKLALSAVIEETDGTKSYWALAHPSGKPDFHAPACFTLTLPPPSDA